MPMCYTDWGGEEGGWNKCFSLFFFLCPRKKGGWDHSLLAVKLHQHPGKGAVIEDALDTYVQNSLPRVLLEWFVSHEMLVVLLH